MQAVWAGKDKIRANPLAAKSDLIPILPVSQTGSRSAPRDDLRDVER
jgi:hypothetical protein